MSFKSPQDYFKKFVENKYVKFVLVELFIIIVVIAGHLIFPTYVEKNNVFWAIVILTGANLTITFTRK